MSVIDDLKNQWAMGDPVFESGDGFPILNHCKFLKVTHKISVQLLIAEALLLSIIFIVIGGNSQNLSILRIFSDCALTHNV